jgi:hypothetical protein
MSGICVQEIATGNVYEWPPNVPFPADYKDRYRIVDCSAGSVGDYAGEAGPAQAVAGGGGVSTGVWVALAALAVLLLTDRRSR